MPESYSQAALRHYADANHLAQNGCFDGAGYLLGYTVECAIKSAIEALRPKEKAPHRHLPELIESAKKALHGRRDYRIAEVIARAGYMKGWSIDARYAPDGSVNAAQYEVWRTDATRMLGAANLRRGAK